MRTKIGLAIILLTALLGACQRSSDQSSQPPAEPANAESNTTPATAEGGAKSEALKHRDKPEKAAEAPKVETITVPTGTELKIRLADAINTGKTQAGTTFTGTLSEPIVVNGAEVAPVGSAVTGKVVNAVSSGRLNRPAELSLALTSFTPAGATATDVTTNTVTIHGKSHKTRDLEVIGGGAGLGAIIGAIAGKGKGAAIGAAVGAGGGTAGAALTGKVEISLPAESPLSFVLSAPVTIERKR